MFIDLQQRYRARGLEFIGVAMDENGWTSVRPYIEKTGVNYAIVAGNGPLAKKYGVESLPVSIVIDRNGRIAAVHSGVVEAESFEAELKRLLESRKN